MQGFARPGLQGPLARAAAAAAAQRAAAERAEPAAQDGPNRAAQRIVAAIAAARPGAATVSLRTPPESTQSKDTQIYHVGSWNPYQGKRSVLFAADVPVQPAATGEVGRLRQAFKAGSGAQKQGVEAATAAVAATIPQPPEPRTDEPETARELRPLSDAADQVRSPMHVHRYIALLMLQGIWKAVMRTAGA